MALTIGAIVFLVGMVFLVYYGYSVGVKKNVKPGEENLQRCSLCTRKFNRSELVERQVGDSKVYYFCHACIESLSVEAQDGDTADKKPQ
jgi:cobalamin biosynthesis protein CobD/CbiB